MEKTTMELLEEALKKTGNTNFFQEVQNSLSDVQSKKEKNRKKHFKIQQEIIGISAAVSIANVLVTFCNSLESFSVIIPVITGISSVLSIIVTALIAIKGSKKYSETWIRHETHLAEMKFEIMEYVFKCEKYKTLSDEDAVDEFIVSMMSIWKNNQKRFENNMAHFDD